MSRTNDVTSAGRDGTGLVRSPGASVTTLQTFLPVVGDPRALEIAFASDPGRWLPAGRREHGTALTMVVRAGSLRRTVAVDLGLPRRAANTRWRAFRWTPVASSGQVRSPIDRLLPEFVGELGLHVPEPGSATLVLDGSYAPPGGKLGATADAAGLHRVAGTTVRRLLEDIAGLLSGEALLVADDPDLR